MAFGSIRGFPRHAIFKALSSPTPKLKASFTGLFLRCLCKFECCTCSLVPTGGFDCLPQLPRIRHYRRPRCRGRFAAAHMDASFRNTVPLRDGCAARWLDAQALLHNRAQYTVQFDAKQDVSPVSAPLSAESDAASDDNEYFNQENMQSGKVAYEIGSEEEWEMREDYGADDSEVDQLDEQ
ncbi:hypothetical protein GGX14DRAFT_566998 [Mycena pura]|uniref:Uncharacterized protein n=1 Tax=Mycena pura TaxID=153505 RepID=A0AAD6VIT9_9AGAR|nr:hypothetical protein GGX14DRAFT_566998 [Mycena pura]